MKTGKKFMGGIAGRVRKAKSVRRSAALLIFLAFLLYGINPTPYLTVGQQKNISPRVASQESPSPAPPGSDLGPPGSDLGPPPGFNSGTPGSWVLIPLAPVAGILWWLFDTESPAIPVTTTAPTNVNAPAATSSIMVPVPCPTLSVSCLSDVDEGSVITFSSSLSSSADVTYNWSVSAGTISSGQGTPSITLDTTKLGGQTVTATLELGGFDPTCARSASCSIGVRPPKPPPSKFDEFGNIRFNDEKARLDNYAIQLQNAPGAQGYIVAYGTCAREAQTRADRAKEYLTYSRGMDAGRLVTIDGGCRSDLTVELWVVASGASPPPVSMSNIISPCPECKRAAPRRRERRRR